MSTVRALAAGIVLAAVAVFATASPALAHDQLISSTPSAGEDLSTAPETVSLEFTNDVLVIGDAGTIVIVADANGHDWVDGTPFVSDRTVTADLTEGMPAAGYELRWQVVSVDGHSISGVIPFTIGGAEPLAATAMPTAAATDASDRQTEGQIQTADDNQGILRTALIGVGGAVGAVAVLALIQFLRRRSRAASASEDSR